MTVRGCKAGRSFASLPDDRFLDTGPRVTLLEFYENHIRRGRGILRLRRRSVAPGTVLRMTGECWAGSAS